MLLKKFVKILDFFPKEYHKIIKIFFLIYLVALLGGYSLAYLKNPAILEFKKTLADQIQNDSILNFVIDKIQNREVFAAIFLTFVYNLLVGSFLTTTLTGLILFLSPIIAFGRGFFIGFVFSGSFSLSLAYFLVLILTMIFEFAAYILSTSYGFSLGLSLFYPDYFGEKTSKKAFLKVLKDFYLFYLPITILLLVGAIWEIFGIINLMRGFNG